MVSCRRPANRLNVFNWSDYMGKDTLPAFQRDSGIEVRYGVFESNEELLAKVFAGNSGWDVVFPSNYFIRPMRENRLLAPLDHNRLPHLNNLDPMLRSPSWDPGLDHSVPYMWGATGIAYRKSLQPAPSSWGDLWHPRLQGRMTMLDDPAETIGAALKMLGLPLNTPDASHLRRAKAALLEQKRLVRAYLNAEARDQIIAGDLLAAQLWATTSAQAMEASPDLGFVYPREGFPLYADSAVILRESSRPGLAHRFIDYLLRAEVAAAIVTQSKTATANAAARRLLPDSVRSNPVFYPDPVTLSRGEWFEPLPAPAQRLRDRLWTEIKSA
jgi:spermidine/putrescine transport system substrate-binding protein